ncbi:MAG: Fe(3+) ABC transporter substrate-binding protein [Sneathiella sp.]|jgi:iron(III) transport system substrate-binding protein|uniref:Fe(3+) ABC transporter substrate-binding protein n=1 Tax=Sneathiella sp. TaxID=1964365 RepID=UPI000C519CE9|nr:Fe(3+) ABC transporter substrate-binding protein [Sneathiella sp.]MAL78497.1 Fe(3+) ABC transporter substrate-binding protein [Sneathiella sp.]|tara:strand:- start:96 stop:1118 length:1023 start_codon:yes stop_codon:yes gene_type:complete
MRLKFSVPLLVAALTVSATATPALAEEVNLYSSRQESLIRPILDEFEKDTGIKVNVVFAKEGTLERLKAEGDNSPADAVLTVDISRLAAHKAAGVLQPIESDVLSANIPAHFRDPAGEWFGLSARSRVIFYAKDRVDPANLSTYEDLADPKWKGKICVRSSSNAYNQSLLASIIVHDGAEAAEKWANGIKDNLARKPQGGDRDQLKAAAAGECDIAIANTYYYGGMQNSKDPEQVAVTEKVALFWPNQDGRGAHFNVSGAGVTKSAKNKDAAIKLIEYLSEDKAQEFYASTNYEFPVKPGVELDKTVAGWGEFKMDEVGLDKVADAQAEAVKIFDRAGWR